MAERLTPEQLDDLDVRLSHALTNPLLTVPMGRVVIAIRQAADDARTLQRVRAWTEDAATEIRGRIAKAEVAALLRAEDES